MKAEYGRAPDQVVKMRILMNNQNPSKSSFLKPNGFKSSAEEYTYFYETVSPYAFQCPDGEVRVIDAINYYWECLSIIESSLGVTDKELANSAFSLVNSIQNCDDTFDHVFGETILIEIEDYMEIHRSSKD